MASDTALGRPRSVLTGFEEAHWKEKRQRRIKAIQ